MKLSKIMIIEDDPVIQGELQTLLNGNGYTTLGVRNFSTVTEQIQDEKPHLILLDIKLPGENGFALCSKIRTFSEVPIIFVTSCNTDMDELNSIMLGGDAFITKPYNTAILLAKIASLLKKAYPAQQREQIAYGDAVLHLESSSLDYHGQSVELTKNELKILYYLFKNGGKICSRGDMIEYLWDNQLYVDDNALSVNINRIREKLAGIGLTDFIKTILQAQSIYKRSKGLATGLIRRCSQHGNYRILVHCDCCCGCIDFHRSRSACKKTNRRNDRCTG